MFDSPEITWWYGLGSSSGKVRIQANESAMSCPMVKQTAQYSRKPGRVEQRGVTTSPHQLRTRATSKALMQQREERRPVKIHAPLPGRGARHRPREKPAQRSKIT